MRHASAHQHSHKTTINKIGKKYNYPFSRNMYTYYIVHEKCTSLKISVPEKYTSTQV